MVLPKNPKNIMGGSRFQRASEKRNVDMYKEEAAEVSWPHDEGRAAGESRLEWRRMIDNIPWDTSLR